MLSAAKKLLYGVRFPMNKCSAGGCPSERSCMKLALQTTTVQQEVVFLSEAKNLGI